MVRPPVVARSFIDGEGLVAIADALSKLKTLNLGEANRNHDDDASGILAIAAALKRNNRLTNLNLSANDVDVEAAKVLAGALSVNTTLVHLDLSSNRLCGVWLESGTKRMGTHDASGIKTLTRALARNAALTDLSLRSNVLGVSGAEAVVDMLDENSILRSCDVRSTDVGEEGKQIVNDAAAKVLKRGVSVLV